ncbi:FAD-binding protein [Bradyrhizobium sp. USDA 4472]
MNRRDFLATALALAAAPALGNQPTGIAAASRPRPGQAGWPSDADWSALNQATAGRLTRVTPPNLAPAEAKQLLANPFYIGDQPGLTESSGWFEAWRSEPSAYMVAAESAADVVAAVRFAKAHNLRLVVKGRGHSYLGGSSAPDSLLLWTRKMDAITVHDGFVPQGSSSKPVPAITTGAGCMWLHAYQAAAGAGALRSRWRLHHRGCRWAGAGRRVRELFQGIWNGGGEPARGRDRDSRRRNSCGQ